jgi:hypothetical protein
MQGQQTLHGQALGETAREVNCRGSFTAVAGDGAAAGVFLPRTATLRRKNR